MERKNLKLLADYLWNLPEGYDHFEIREFNADAKYPVDIDAQAGCNTVACAVGHAPYVEGLPKPLGCEYWADYSERIFNLDTPDRCGGWDWCFSPSWYNADNTPKGAAKRIYYLLSLEGEDDLPIFDFTEDDVALYQDMTPEDVEG